MSVYPISFWVVIAIIIAGGAWAIQRIKDGTGIPTLAVILTVAVWYVGDAFYNDYAHSYLQIFEADVLQNAWWQVAWFLVVFLAAVPYVHEWYNARFLHQQSGLLQLSRYGTNEASFQRQIDILFKGCVITYAIIVAVATIRLGSQIPYFFFPFLGYKAEPWGRERIGSGFDAALTFALYVQLAVAAIFGVLAAVAHTRRTQILSIILCLISWPYFLFDRTRNTILAVVIPGLMSLVFLRLRGGILMKFAVLGICYIVLNGWMGFIIQNRSDETIASAFREKGFNLQQDSDVHHQGLNMFEELCWINTFIKNGAYEPNWGARYFAELVNPIPRALWHGKPLIGLDYAKARGQGLRGEAAAAGDDEEGNVYATVSTGLIGQGVVNFGRVLGPAAAALLMSLWVAILARQDLFIWNLGRLPLYAIGLILTFNLGRDITFITLYPFVFLVIFLWWWDRRTGQSIGAHQAAMAQGGQAFAPATQFAPQNPTPVARQPVQMSMRRRKVVTRSLPPPETGRSAADPDGTVPKV